MIFLMALGSCVALAMLAGFDFTTWSKESSAVDRSVSCALPAR
jgi:hypothetical protein